MSLSTPTKSPFPLNRGFGDGQFDGNDLAIAPQSLYFPRSDPQDPGFASFQIPGEITVVPIPIWFGHQHGHVPSEKLFLGIIENVFSGSVDRFDHTPHIDRDDAVGCIVHHRTQVGFSFPKFLLGPNQIRDILNRSAHAETRAVGVGCHLRFAVNMADISVRPNYAELDAVRFVIPVSLA